MYQFIHVDAYARTGSTQTRDGKTTTDRSAKDIASEAMRIDGYCRHVKLKREPLPPVLVYGVDPFAAVELAEKWASQAKDAKGRALRKDGMVMAAGVISIPADSPIDWTRFKADCVDFLKAKYGDRLRSVVEHIDEDNPHMHFYAVPLDGESFDCVHEGLAARNATRRDKKAAPGAANIAFKQAMIAMQDDFFEKVSSRHGLLRLGPKRQRLGRGEYMAQKAQAALAAKTYAVVDQKASLEASVAQLELQVPTLEESAQKAIAAREKAETELAAIAKKKAEKTRELANTTLAKVLVPLARHLTGDDREAVYSEGARAQLEKDKAKTRAIKQELDETKQELNTVREHSKAIAQEKNAAIEAKKNAELAAKNALQMQARLASLEAENARLNARLNNDETGPKGP